MLDYILRVPSKRPDSDSLPLVLVMHGRGADANDLADVAPMLDPPGGARFVFPNAPKPFEAYPGMTFGFTWFDGWPIVHGTDDDMIPVLAARRARRLLEQHGIEPEYHEFAMGHHVTNESMEVVRDFIARATNSAAAAPSNRS
jgi:predicted esterase